MPMSFGDRIRHAWNAFNGKDKNNPQDFGYSSSLRPDHLRLARGNSQSLINSVYTRIANDVASVTIRHVRQDENERFLETIQDGLDNCLFTEANLDQSSRSFIIDLVLSVFDSGVAAIVPIDTTTDIRTSSFDVNTIRIGEIIQWYPQYVRVRVYNENSGQKEELTLPKKSVAIVENPFYSIMNEPNSTLRRLIRKMDLADQLDDQIGSGKLDLIFQLPFTVKTDTRRQQAEHRRKELENQLTSGQYGIAYTDASEHVVQLNRPVENNFQKQIEYLTNNLYSQLGLTQAVFNGSASEAEMLNYFNRTVEPVLSTIVNELNRKFLTKTARSQHQAIMFFKDPFKLVPVSQLAEIADKFTRNAILSSNDVRSFIGMQPSDSPDAQALRNKNLMPTDSGIPEITTGSSNVE